MMKEVLRLPGASGYSNYDKADFKKRAEKMIKAGDAANWRLTDAARGTLLSQYRAKPRPPLELIAYSAPDLHGLIADVSSCLETTVVARVIQRLFQDPELATWTHKGLELHRERASSECLFCGQLVPAERLAALDAHFSTEYDQLVADIDALIKRLEETSRSAASVAIPNRAQLYDDLGTEFDLARVAFVGFLESVKACCTELVAALREKKAHVFKREECGVAALNTASGLDRLNAVLERHNRMSADFASVVKMAGEQLEADEVSRILTDYRRLVASKVTAETALQRSRDENAGMLQMIRSIEAEITEYRRPAEELNADLQAYLGHGELKLEASETGYSIRRAGEPARNLSEGECTAIALLYFLKALSDRRFELANGIVVIDDPVSSLDSNAIFLAFSYIRSRGQDAGQLFLLTHDFTLFREARNWLDNLPKPAKKAVRFYMLDCCYGDTGRFASILPLDPMLRNHGSEYDYLFARVYRAANASAQIPLGAAYVLPNIARRLLESFVAFHKPGAKSTLWKALTTMQMEESKRLRLYRFLNAYSHDAAVPDVGHDPTVLKEAQPVLQDLMELIKAEDPSHFTGMEELVLAANASPGASDHDT
jgi:wobble nucleotide-excising tRNase